MRLYELANVIRTKNAGPFTLTIDLMFEHEAEYHRVLQTLSEAMIAAEYSVDDSAVRIHPFQRVLAIKITMPRPVSSGAPGDYDVYGSQQHFPLAEILINE